MKPWQVPKSKRQNTANNPFGSVDFLDGSGGGGGGSSSELGLKKFIEANLTSGQMILSNRGLKEVPNSLYSYYRAGEREVDLDLKKEEDKVNWWEIPSLTKLYLADNAIERLDEKFSSTFSELVILDLHNNQFASLPTSLENLAQLTSLNLSRNQFTMVPECIYKLNLVELNLSFNLLTELDFNVEKGDSLKNLVALDVSNNKLKSIVHLNWLDKLKRLDLNHNQLSILDDSCTQLSALDYLDVSFNLLTELPGLTTESNLSIFPKLKTLLVHRNKIRNLNTTSTSTFSTLTSLNVNDNLVISLVNFDKVCPLITHLSLGNNQLQTFPLELLQLHELISLDLSNNQITRIPNQLANLTNLKEVSLFGNVLRNCPKFDTTEQFLGALKARLEKEEATNNSQNQNNPSNPSNGNAPNAHGIETFNTTIPSITDFKGSQLSFNKQQLTTEDFNIKLNSFNLVDPILKLEVKHNLLTTSPAFPNAIYDTLVMLDLSNNQLNELQFNQPLPNLTSIDLSTNRFVNFPFGDKNTDSPLFPKVTLMNCSFNKITDLPKHRLEVTNFPKLHTLYLQNNKLTSLNAGLEFLKKLYTVDLSNNDIGNLPNELMHGEVNLLEVNLLGNLLKFPRQNILQKGGKQVVEYLKARVPQT